MAPTPAPFRPPTRQNELNAREDGWHRRVWRLAAPNILANLTIPLLGAVDTAVVGRLGAAEIGAVAIGATVFSFLYWGFSFLRMGTAGLAAQAHGAEDADACWRPCCARAPSPRWRA